MENLEIVLKKLERMRDSFKGNYFIPEAWNFAGFGEYTSDGERKGEIDVNPYDYIVFCIKNHIMSKAETDGNFLVPLGCRNGCCGNNLNKSTIYSMFPRMLTAWDHYEKGKLNSGTFLKAICHLPYLKSLDVDIIYLLPVFKYSSRYKKGEIGSPYAIKNVYKFDKNLHDHLLGEYTETLLETEFKAFVEACHILGIQVMLDFVFRTVSRDNDLMIEHPDWFYWIDLKYNETFVAPSVDKIKKPMVISGKSVLHLYKSKGLREYLAKFAHSPKEIDPQKWEKLVQIHKLTGENMLDLVEAEFGITTAPGFSDVINDRQPAWTDATYLRFYYDTHKKAKEYIDNDQPPYIMQDGVCLNLYRGEIENKELRDYISGVIPYYQGKYGIDGARIDMGHALSPELNKEIVITAKANNKNFILWSEEFHPEKSEAAKEDGFHFISGFTWAIYKELEKEGFNKKLILDTLMKAAIPVTAALETPDTPRSALVHKDRRTLEQLVLLNCFIPNAIPFINNGQEVMEIQPMNLGLDNTEQGKFVLNEEDPMYGKLAFFDNYRVHWLNSEHKWMQELLLKAFRIRRRYIDIISKKENFIVQPGLAKSKKLIFLCYFDERSGKGIFLLANRSLKTRMRARFSDLIPQQAGIETKTVNFVYAGGDSCDTVWLLDRNRLLAPGEVIIGCIGQ